MIFDKLLPKILENQHVRACVPEATKQCGKTCWGIELFAMENHGKSTISNG